MRIEQAQVAMNVSSYARSEQQESMKISFWKGDRPKVELQDAVGGVSLAKAGENGFAASDMATILSSDQFDISRQGLEYSYSLDTSECSQTNGTGDVNYEISSEDQIKIKLIENFLRKLTGKDVLLRIPIKIKVSRSAEPDLTARTKIQMDGQNGQNANQGWGLEIDATQLYSESSSYSFSSAGLIKTEDGREISFNLNIQASREFLEKTSFSLRAGDAALTDPLVLSLKGGLPDLLDEQMSFDLDSDGSEDQISKLAEGNGYLALDLNEDGLVSNGSELFGTASGDGFADLAAYDSDGNSWIDESDPIFNQLRIWEQHGDGSSTLLALGEVGIGAIYLGHMAGAFDIKNESNDMQGRIQSSGIYLWENGQAGTLHQLDLIM